MKLDYEKCLQLLEQDPEQAMKLIENSELDLTQQEDNFKLLSVCIQKGLKEIIDVLLKKGLLIDTLALQSSDEGFIFLVLEYVVEQEGREEEAEKIIDKIIELKGKDVLEFMERVRREVEPELKVSEILQLNYSHVLSYVKNLWHPIDLARNFDEILKLDRHAVLSFLRQEEPEEAEQVIEGLLVLKCFDLLCILAEFANVSFFQKIIQKYNLKIMNRRGDEFTDKRGRAVVHFAARNEDVEMLKFLKFEMGCSLDKEDKKERSPLYDAVRTHNLNVLSWLTSRKEVNFSNLHNTHYCSETSKQCIFDTVNQSFRKYFAEKGLAWAMERITNMPHAKAELIEILQEEIKKYAMNGEKINLCAYLKALLITDMKEGVKLVFEYLSPDLRSKWPVMVQRTIINKEDRKMSEKFAAREEIIKILLPENLVLPNVAGQKVNDKVASVSTSPTLRM